MYQEVYNLKFSYTFISFDHEISTDNDITRIKEDLEKDLVIRTLSLLALPLLVLLLRNKQIQKSNPYK